jgi:hypothetical protein
VIKYQYAKDVNDQPVDINSLNEVNRHLSKYYCIGCGKEVIPKLGTSKKRAFHFAHKILAECSGETYLHLLGKELFYSTFKDSQRNNIPFLIEIPQYRICNHYTKQFDETCSIDRSTTTFNLIDHFIDIKMETREGEFIPDLVLISKNSSEKLFIEIAVTHLSSEAKLKSNYRIIEIKVKDESDLNPIKERKLSVRNRKIKFKNFQFKQVTKSFCGGRCEGAFYLFTLDNKGNSLMSRKSLSLIKYILAQNKEKIIHSEIEGVDGASYLDLFKFKIATCIEDKLKVKNCFLCRYHDLNTSSYHDGLIFCKYLRIGCNSDKAVECPSFKLEQNYVDEYLDLLDYDSPPPLIPSPSNFIFEDEDEDEYWDLYDD